MLIFTGGGGAVVIYISKNNEKQNKVNIRLYVIFIQT